jgi:hypothetical protein
MNPRISSVITIGILLFALLGAAGGVAAMPAPQGTAGTGGPVPQDTVQADSLDTPQAGETWLIIPAAAFTPMDGGYGYFNYGSWLVHKHDADGGGAIGMYVAPVYLPDGATIDRVFFGYFDTNPSTGGDATLYRSTPSTDGPAHWTKVAATIVTQDATSASGWRFTYASSIPEPVVSHTFMYFVVWVLPVSPNHIHPGAGDILGSSMGIRYILPGSASYLPMLRR